MTSSSATHVHSSSGKPKTCLSGARDTTRAQKGKILLSFLMTRSIGRSRRSVPGSNNAAGSRFKHAAAGAQVTRAESPPYSRIAAAYASIGELDFSRRMSHWILTALLRGDVGNMLDLACGAGEAVRVFRNAGWQALGLDKSASMLRLACARNGPGATFRRGSMQQRFGVPAQFNLVTCMYDAINCNLLVKDLLATFRNAHFVLAPSGRFVFDAYTPRGLYLAYPEGWKLYARNRDHIVFSAARFDQRRRVGTKEFIGASRMRKWRLWREVHQVRAYPTKVLMQALSQARFRSMTVYGWPSGLMVSPRGAENLDRIVIVAQRGEGRRSGSDSPLCDTGKLIKRGASFTFPP